MKSSHSKKILILCAVILYFYFSSQSFSQSSSSDLFESNSRNKVNIVIVDNNSCSNDLENKNSQEDDFVIAPPPLLSTYELPKIIATSKYKPHRTFSIIITLGYDSDNGQLEKELSTKKDEIINICKSVIINRAYKEISSETILDLAEDFKLNINKILTSGKIKEIFFQEFDVR